jgi:enoyl-CoA hydratase/carnithine racemase
VELGSATVEIESDRGVRAAVLTDAGTRFFCRGPDISAWSGMGAVEFARQWIRAGHSQFDRLARLSVPLIAAINGAAFGGGLELAALCDLRVAGRNLRVARSRDRRHAGLVGRPTARATFAAKVGARNGSDRWSVECRAAT